MKKCCFLIMAVLFLLIASSPARAALTIKFKNENTNYTSNQINILIHDNGVKAFSATYGGGTAMQLEKNYSFSTIGAAGMSVNTLWGGVIYFCLGDTMAENAVEPSPTSTSDPDYNKRWGKAEISFDGNASDVANLTGINVYSMNIQMKTYKSGSEVQTPLTWTLTGNQMASKLGAITSFDSTSYLKNGSDFLRVIGPTSYAKPSVGPYPSLQPYVDAVKAASQSTKIVGSYSGPGGSTEKTTQTYSFTATIDADGNLVLTGKGALQGSSHTITIAAADVAAQIYYQDPTWKIDETTDGTFADNDVYGAAVRDILAGFAIGYVNSPVINPATGQPFKDSDSNTWWGSAENFDTLQTDPLKPYFNQYAMEFYRYSNSYGFPYSDRLESKPVQIGLNPATVDTLEITIMTDGAAVPEPSTMAFFGVGLIGLAAVSLKRSRR